MLRISSLLCQRGTPVPALCLLGLFLGACGGPDEASAPGSSSDERTAEVTVATTDRRALGEATYASHCATCHDDGSGSAPKIGDAASWSTRSPLWVAVLAEHAKAGYLEMPAKGGDGVLNDEAVAAATEYMLMRTFPEWPSSD